jgi:hypothetical protein
LEDGYGALTAIPVVSSIDDRFMTAPLKEQRKVVLATVGTLPNYLTYLPAIILKGQVSDEGDSVSEARKSFPHYYQPMVPCGNRLRKAVFPNAGGEKGRTVGYICG